MTIIQIQSEYVNYSGGTVIFRYYDSKYHTNDFIRNSNENDQNLSARN